MSDNAKELLLGLAKHPRAKDGAELKYSKDSSAKRAEISAADELVRLEYVVKIGSAIGFAILAIAPAGEIAVNKI